MDATLYHELTLITKTLREILEVLNRIERNQPNLLDNANSKPRWDYK